MRERVGEGRKGRGPGGEKRQESVRDEEALKEKETRREFARIFFVLLV